LFDKWDTERFELMAVVIVDLTFVSRSCGRLVRLKFMNVC